LSLSLGESSATSWSEVNEALEAFRVLCPDPLPVTTEVHESALKIAEQYGYNIYDALVIAAALDERCATRKGPAGAAPQIFLKTFQLAIFAGTRGRPSPTA
jgi:hypothetical protein